MKETLKQKIGQGKQLRIAAIQFQQEGDDSFKVPAILNDARFDTEQLLHVIASGVIGLYIEENDEEKVRRYIDKSDGRSIILYFNAHVVSEEMHKKHPEWSQIAPDGAPVTSYGTEYLICVNSTWRDYFLNIVRSSLALPIDGIFLDGPLFTGAGCYCPHCAKLFADQFGHPLENATNNEIRAFKSKHIARMIKDIREVITENGKDIVLYANSLGLTENVTGCDIDTIYPYVDMLGTEGGFIFYGDPNDVSLWKGSQSARYLESKSYGKPYVIFCAGNHQPWARVMHTPDETRLMYAYVTANGASIWYGIHGQISNFNTPGGEAAFEFNRYLADNSEYYTATKRMSDVAVVWSKNTIHAFPETVEETDFTAKRGDAKDLNFGSFQKEFNGFYDILTRAHSQFSVIDEQNIIHDDLSQYKMIVLPNTVCLNSESAEKIKQYVAGGGTLISTMASGFCDENGERLDSPALAEVYGLDSVENFTSFDPGCGYLTLTQDWLLDGCNPDIVAGFSGHAVRGNYKNGAEVLGLLHEPMAGRYSKFEKESFPSLVLNKYGKGTSIYISGALGETYTEYGVADYKQLVKNILDKYANLTLTAENAYETVEILMREQKNKSRRIIHFVNYTGAMKRPIENIIPCKNIKISIVCKTKISRVHSLWSKAELPFIQNGNTVSFDIDVNGAYEAVVLE